MPQKKFNDQVAVVTGAGKGIGFEISRQLALQGCSVVLNDIDTKQLNISVEKIKTEGGNCIGIPGDASDISFLESLVHQTVNQFGKITIVIANAGVTEYEDFFNFKPDAFDKVIQLNLRGSFFLVQYAAMEMKNQRTGGRILLMSSVVGHQAHKNLAAYAMTKAGLEMMAKNLVIELSPYNITINAIAPGATLTERTLDDKNYESTWNRITPLGKPATTLDIANAALFLVSPGSGHITGQSLIIDGGWTSVSPSPY